MATGLTPSEREFFSGVSEAAFTNPFSAHRAVLDLRITGETFLGTPKERKLKEAVTTRVAKLESVGRAHLRHYRGADAEMMRNVFLFEIYHGCCESLDDLTAAQIKAGDQPLPVKFAGETLSALVERGFSEGEAARYFAIFFQLRRAYRFIFAGLTGSSSSMQELRRHLWNNVFTHDIRWYERYLCDRLEDFSTLLLGETGTGKGTAATALGRAGFIPFDPARNRFVESFTRSFVSVNVSQFPETLIESELFGHRRGAFTGAVEAHQGAFARCSTHGSIFLDEIGDVSVPVQVKLLQVLQERTFSPVGSHEKVRFGGRVIAATNRSIEELRAQKLFRDDFFYRLCSDVITLPPLRQRIEESPAELESLLQGMIERMTGETAGELVELVRDVLAESVGKNYSWPGNVRELEQAVRRILVTRAYQPERQRTRDSVGELCETMREGGLTADTLLARYCTLLYERFGTFEEVARRSALDARTVKRYLALGRKMGERG